MLKQDIRQCCSSTVIDGTETFHKNTSSGGGASTGPHAPWTSHTTVFTALTHSTTRDTGGIHSTHSGGIHSMNRRHALMESTCAVAARHCSRSLRRGDSDMDGVALRDDDLDNDGVRDIDRDGVRDLDDVDDRDLDDDIDREGVDDRDDVADRDDERERDAVADRDAQGDGEADGLPSEVSTLALATW
jgi:hypothetical protein